jgi:hypothetical protein
MRTLLAGCSILALTSSAVLAADLGAGESSYVEPAAVVVSPAWAAVLGIAFDAYFVDQADNDEGTDQPEDDDDWNLGGHVDLSVGGTTGAFGVQGDIRGSLFSNDHESDDWTKSYLTGALHLYMDMQASKLGVFGGGGITDGDDTDEDQTYWFAGLEGQRVMGNAVLFGQLGYLDGEDEFDEGINQAGFAQIGARWFAQPNMAFMAALSGAFGQQDNGDASDSDAWIGDVALEAEYGFGNSGASVFASYEGTFVSFDGGDHNTNFHGAMLGFRWRPGSPDLMTAYSGPASLQVAPVDRWFAFTANEVE